MEKIEGVGGVTKWFESHSADAGAFIYPLELVEIVGFAVLWQIGSLGNISCLGNLFLVCLNASL
jgi:hypothetical protein